MSAINVHICCRIVSDRAGNYAPGMSAAYENQALKGLGHTILGNFSADQIVIELTKISK